MHYNSTRRLPVFLLAASLLLGACGSSADTSSETTVVVAETSADQSVATTVAEQQETLPESPETNPSTIAQTTPPLETTAPSTVAASSEQATGDSLDSSVAQLVTQLTGQPAEATDIECISSKITNEDLELTATGTDTNTAAFRKVFGVIFGCNPAGLAESFAGQTFSATEGVTDVQRTCIGTKLVEIIAASPEIISAISTDAAKPPAEFVDGAKSAVTGCVPAGPVQESLLAEISKS
jgi:hypothetical protein